MRRKALAIEQSVDPPRRGVRHASGRFDVCVLGHLRAVKDPFRAALAARLLPADSRVRILQVGGALLPGFARRARVEQARNPRYRWLGELPRRRALAVLRGCRLLVLSSKLEGGANVVSEAVVAGVPVLSSRIEGSLGLLGAGYPGCFPAGDTRALARLLRRAESDRRFYAALRRACGLVRPLFAPARERRLWAALLEELKR
jgi:glycosyltransferase involved in cell wall biosynthesis